MDQQHPDWHQPVTTHTGEITPQHPQYVEPMSAREAIDARREQARLNVAHQAGNVKQSRDRAQYVRQQKGHSLILNLLLIGPLTLWITTIYYSVSPNHYWHA